MRKLIASINVTLDGFCDHDKMHADDELHEHYNELLRTADTMIWGRKTYQLMEDYWPSLIQKPSEDSSENAFAMLVDNISKIVYSRTLESVKWKNSILKHDIVKEEILELKKQPGKNILVGSPSLIVALSNLGLVDEYQFAVQPIILGSGLSLFKNITERIDLKLSKTKTFDSGAIMLCYETKK